MSETVLNALVKLFALIGDIHDETVITIREKNIVRSFLSRHLNQELVERYMRTYEEYLTVYNAESIKKGTVQDRKRTALNSMRILGICEKINEELQQKQKIYVLVQLTEYISLGLDVTENELEFLSTIADAFYIPEEEYQNIVSFIMRSASDVPDKSRLVTVDGKISFLHIASTNSMILRYSGDEDLYLNGQNLLQGQTYIFDHGSTIRGAGIKNIYYSEIVGRLSSASFPDKVYLDVNDVNFRFRNSENGIHNLHLHEESGHLVGILGGSGAGKSTTLSILNGTLKPQSGSVLINGYNLYDGKERENLKGVIGFVPQDDLLIEELTVFQNIWFNARMCLSNLSEEQILGEVDKILNDFDLNEIRDLKVGNPLKKIISGGQRKRVNIALELLRQPTILFADEPTSGLSSVDSEAVMGLLKEQTYQGKLVIVNIHQPSSDIFKMFDRIMLIDKGGYQVFYGNPSEAVVYFKTITNHANPDEDQCVKCGNINTEQILQIIEAKVIDEQGRTTRIRRVNPEEWAARFRENNPAVTQDVERSREPLPENKFSIPGLLKQSRIFFMRDLLSKLANTQYIIISLLGPPLLAFLLAYFTRAGKGENYLFSENENIPAYLFMCIITSLFFGLMISSEEIVKDRKILKRESFLNLSWFSYLNSKIMILFIVSAVQTIAFVLIGNLILGIKGMTISYWLVLFTTSCFANVLGLNISSAFDSVITIYILIPFIIIPQILFSGVMVKFDKLHLTSFSSREYVPVIGDLMTARWSFEALAVEQFRNNRFEKPVFESKMAESQNCYYADYLIDNLAVDLAFCRRNIKNISEPDLQKEFDTRFGRLNFYIDQLANMAGLAVPDQVKNLSSSTFDDSVAKQTSAFLTSLNKEYTLRQKRAKAERDSTEAEIIRKIGKNELTSLRNNYENIKLRSMILNEEYIEKTSIIGNKIIQKYAPGYMKATSRYGRAHFYAPVKKLGNLEIETYWFNLAVIWLGAIFLYFALYFNLLQRLTSSSLRFRFKKAES